MADLDIKLNDKTVTLKWKLSVQKKISTEFGGLLPAHRAIMEFDLDAFAKIVAIGTEKVLPDSLDEVCGDVFATGMETLQPDLLKFLNRLVSGGKDPEPAAIAA
ncbi:hypothetical protein AB7828_03845 [Tardiphaga sp. 215_C5_N2_1]|uniref:hypothetical protein n=1 Tax=Tardiphaga sp. 215_C5_N2_1 TaxID=3240774 RepID=UPI003F8ACDDC